MEFTGVNEKSECLAGFTGRKLRQRPAHAGMTSLGTCLKNDTVDQSIRMLLESVHTENSFRIENAVFHSVREIIIVSTMTPFFIAILALVGSTIRTRAAQQAEILALRHQIAVLQQSAPRRLRLRQSDRLFSSRNRFRLRRQMVAAAESKRRRISIFSRTFSANAAGIWRVFGWPSTSTEIWDWE